MVFSCFFFSSRRRHTRWNCDWSSDVCSSDLGVAFPGSAAHHFMLRRARTRGERRMHFASDNAAGIAPAILAAIGRANDGFALGYGEDAITKRLERRLAE